MVKWMSGAGLSKDAINKNLEQARTTPQPDEISQQIYVANRDVLSKVRETDNTKQNLQSIQLELNQLDTTVQQHIADRNHHVDQVHGIHARVCIRRKFHTHSRMCYLHVRILT